MSYASMYNNRQDLTYMNSIFEYICGGVKMDLFTLSCLIKCLIPSWNQHVRTSFRVLF